MRESVVLIAEAKSSHGYIYSDEALIDMAQGIPGLPVFEHEPGLESPLWECDLTNLIGIAKSAEVVEGKVSVAVSWLSAAQIPVGKFLTPTGSGRLQDGKVVGYRPKHLTLSDTSAFECSTKVSI